MSSNIIKEFGASQIENDAVIKFYNNTGLTNTEVCASLVVAALGRDTFAGFSDTEKKEILKKTWTILKGKLRSKATMLSITVKRDGGLVPSKQSVELLDPVVIKNNEAELAALQNADTVKQETKSDSTKSTSTKQTSRNADNPINVKLHFGSATSEPHDIVDYTVEGIVAQIQALCKQKNFPKAQLVSKVTNKAVTMEELEDGGEFIATRRMKAATVGESLESVITRILA